MLAVGRGSSLRIEMEGRKVIIDVEKVSPEGNVNSGKLLGGWPRDFEMA